MADKITVQTITDYIDSLAPFGTKCEWDNCGLLVGNSSREVTKIGLALDITNDVVDYAVKNGINLLISHHPVIFAPLRSVTQDNIVYKMLENGISAVCAHTCLDKAAGGVNDALASLLGFDACPLCSEGEQSMVRVAQIEETSANELAEYIKSRLKTGVRIADCGKRIKKIALCGGSGCDFIPFAVDEGCDAYITGDASHHDFLNAVSAGITLIAAGHFETENPIISVLKEKIDNKFGANCVIIPQNSPVKYYY